MMSTQTPTPNGDQPDAGPRLWRETGFVTDHWTRVEVLSDAPAQAHAILPLQAFLDIEAATRAARDGRIGVHLAPGEAIDSIIAHLDDLPIVSLAFPAFNDGRSYSKAQLLRTRHGYKGVVRAAGDVLIDQIPLMIRTGFDEFEIRNPTALRRLEEGRVGGIAYLYQPAARSAAETGSYSWRRLSA